MPHDFRNLLPRFLRMFNQRKPNIVCHVQRIEQRTHLKQESETSPHFNHRSLRQRVDPLPIKPNLTPIRPQQADDVLQQNALTSPASADDDKALPLLNLQRQTLQHDQLAEALGDMFEFDEGHENRVPDIDIRGSTKEGAEAHKSRHTNRARARRRRNSTQ